MAPMLQQLDSDGLFPWRFLIRALEAAFQAQVLLIAVVATLLASAGDWALPEAAALIKPAALELGPTTTWPLSRLISSLLRPLDSWRSIAMCYWLVPSHATLLGLGVWRLAVWVLAGGAIARLVVAKLGYLPAPAGLASMKHSATYWPGRMLALTLLTVFAGSLLLPLWLHGWALGIGWLAWASAMLYPLALIAGMAAVTLALLLLLGWPLLVIAGAVERPDLFDSVSRTLAYCTQRPVQMVGYLTTACAIYIPIAIFLSVVTSCVEQLSLASLAPHAEVGSPGHDLALFWTRTLLALVPQAIHAAYFWSLTPAVYLLLRRDIDGVPVDEILDDTTLAHGAEA